MNEQWKDIPQYEGLYQVSNLGRVKRLYMVIEYCDGRVYTYHERILKPTINAKYSYVDLYDRQSKKRFAVHRLVYSVFIGELIDGLCIDHIDNNQSNNNLNNLQQITQLQNVRKELDFWAGTDFRWDKMKWRARFKKKHIGYFNNRFDAILSIHKQLNLMS